MRQAQKILGTSDATFFLHIFSANSLAEAPAATPKPMQELERWTQGHDVLKKELLFIPINEGLHWWRYLQPRQCSTTQSHASAWSECNNVVCSYPRRWCFS